jgi:hypothetical protein
MEASEPDCASLRATNSAKPGIVVTSRETALDQIPQQFLGLQGLTCSQAKLRLQPGNQWQVLFRPRPISGLKSASA